MAMSRRLHRNSEAGEESRIDQDISDINADNYSIAVAGVVKDLDFKNLRPSGPGHR